VLQGLYGDWNAEGRNHMLLIQFAVDVYVSEVVSGTVGVILPLDLVILKLRNRMQCPDWELTRHIACK
jgi:hypothetical protein